MDCSISSSIAYRRFLVKISVGVWDAYLLIAQVEQKPLLQQVWPERFETVEWAALAHELDQLTDVVSVFPRSEEAFVQEHLEV